jgi:DNA-binding transcriptional ArsR family regulator
MATRLLRNDDAKAARAAAMVQALAHPVRLRLLAALCEEAAPAAALADRLGLPRATVTRHLRPLAAAGLLTASGPPRQATWRVAEPAVHGLVACMEECAR